MIFALILLAALASPGPTMGSPTPDAQPSCKDLCTIEFNKCYEGGGSWRKCSEEQTACYNRCDGLGAEAGNKDRFQQRAVTEY